MQHHFRQGGGGGRHEYFRRGLLLLQHGQGAQMVQMGMAQENGFHGIGFQNVKLRHGRQSLPLRVHPAVKHYPGAVHFKQITIGPDLFGPADIRKTDHYMRQESNGSPRPCQCRPAAQGSQSRRKRPLTEKWRRQRKLLPFSGELGKGSAGHAAGKRLFLIPMPGSPCLNLSAGRQYPAIRRRKMKREFPRNRLHALP